jgi:hypothetical protein
MTIVEGKLNFQQYVLLEMGPAVHFSTIFRDACVLSYLHSDCDVESQASGKITKQRYI